MAAANNNNDGQQTTFPPPPTYADAVPTASIVAPTSTSSTIEPGTHPSITSEERTTQQPRVLTFTSHPLAGTSTNLGSSSPSLAERTVPIPTAQVRQTLATQQPVLAPQRSYLREQVAAEQTSSGSSSMLSSTVYACPQGGNHLATETFSPFGVCLAVLFFPLGILCCLVLRDTRCAKCGAILQPI